MWAGHALSARTASVTSRPAADYAAATPLAPRLTYAMPIQGSATAIPE
jgi:hypothetical protein